MDASTDLASASIDALIEKRARGRDAANAAAGMWKESAARHAAKLREQRRRDWVAFYAGLAASLRDSARKYERMAQDLSNPKGSR